VGATQTDREAERGDCADGIAAVHVGFDYVECETIQGNMVLEKKNAGQILCKLKDTR